MTTILSAALLAIATFSADAAQAQEPKWETSFEQATRRAAEEGKPVLLLQLFGRLDEELC